VWLLVGLKRNLAFLIHRVAVAASSGNEAEDISWSRIHQTHRSLFG
jgi:hypothetical protein